ARTSRPGNPREPGFDWRSLETPGHQVWKKEQSRRVRWMICCIRRGAFTILIFAN
ncbi:unnamed protein product, partial [Ascophyllum nodosum]